MAISKDLVEAIMMLAFITLVLVGTSDFDSETTKEVIMGVLGLITVGMGTLRAIQARHPKKETPYE